MARLFVALELPVAVRAALTGWAVAAAAPVLTGARVVPEASLHVTLCFLGARPVGEARAIGEAVAEVAEGWAGGPVCLRVRDIVWLGPRRSRVCAVALSDGRDPGGLAGLQADVSARLAAGGWYVPERRRFLAHVTVARMRASPRRRASVVDADPAAAGSVASGPVASGPVAPGPVPPPSLPPFAAEAVVLYRSWPGSRYEPLSRIELPVPPDHGPRSLGGS